ncbi:glycosyltransferase [Mycetocola manganoxydans]|uniref:Glycosyltransferase n=1 Tax=Mycetocola manganoxydans TaxID=699879 RepID=A0A3L7A0S8_9MICO|nr:glycosyltransferase [Mycetocola manganoxydans]RLP73886.1 glycosyltransferase [Mycetocola manganoxydans]GHD42517.1 glycosyl hydrolase [Mycetocola manganoxydans]
MTGDVPQQRPAPFSLLLPVYGNDDPAQFTRAFSSSVDAQTLPPDEVVVVQDGAITAALETAVAKAVASTGVPVVRVRIPERGGLANALTAGLAACSHDIVARMDADDVSLSSRFERQLAKVHEGFDLVGTGMLEFAHDTSEVIGRRTPPTGAANIAKYARFHDPFNHPTVMYRRAAVDRAGGYEDIGLMEDYWLFARMIHSGARVENLPDPLLMYRVGAGAYSRRGGRRQFEAELSLQRALRSIRFTTRAQFCRNITVRGIYRFVPVGMRTRLYRRLIARGFKNTGV